MTNVPMSLRLDAEGSSSSGKNAHFVISNAGTGEVECNFKVAKPGAVKVSSVGYGNNKPA
jgi:hypothetical protein